MLRHGPGGGREGRLLLIEERPSERQTEGKAMELVSSLAVSSLLLV